MDGCFKVAVDSTNLQSNAELPYCSAIDNPMSRIKSSRPWVKQACRRRPERNTLPVSPTQVLENSRIIVSCRVSLVFKVPPYDPFAVFQQGECSPRFAAECNLLHFGWDNDSLFWKTVEGENRDKTCHSYPHRRQLFRLGLLMTQKVVDGRGDDQGQHHRDQDSTNYSDGKRL